MRQYRGIVLAFMVQRHTQPKTEFQIVLAMAPGDCSPFAESRAKNQMYRVDSV